MGQVLAVGLVDVKLNEPACSRMRLANVMFANVLANVRSQILARLFAIMRYLLQSRVRRARELNCVARVAQWQLRRNRRTVDEMPWAST